MQRKYNKLFRNTIFLYLMTFSNQLINLITIPYQTRVLGPVIYGKISVATSLMMYVQLIMDFGFLLSATEKVARNRDDTDYTSRLFTAVTMIKVVLGICAGVVLYGVCGAIAQLRMDRILYMLYYMAYAVSALIPDFLYRGREEMQTVTVRTVLIRLFFASLMLIFVRESDDYLWLPLLLLAGNLIAVVFSFWHVRKVFSVEFRAVDPQFLLRTIRDAVPFFISRIAITFYQALSALILGVRFAGQPVIGYYGSADKLLGIARSFSSPVADSLYPHMVRRKDYSIIRKLLLVTIPVILVGAAFVFWQAEWICVLLFGEEYAAAGNILRCLLPAMIVTLPTYILSFPTLNPIGLSGYANLSNVIGCGVMVALLGVLFAIDRVDAYSLCIAASISEVTVCLFRAAIAWKYRDRMKTGTKKFPE